MVINNSTKVEDMPQLFLDEVVSLEPCFTNGCNDKDAWMHINDVPYREFLETHEDGNSYSWYIPVGAIEDWLVEKSYQCRRESMGIGKMGHALLLKGIIDRVKYYCEVEIKV